MKKIYLIVFACLVATIMMSGSAFAGQEPYVALVDEDTAIDLFYISAKLFQFTHPNTDYTPEGFWPKNFLIRKTEICDENAVVHNINYKTPAGNSGWYRWVVVLPKKLEGDLNLVFQCGILKPNTEALYGVKAINFCAGETGEKVGPNCTRKPHSDLTKNALPQIRAIAYPGPQANFVDKFYLTSIKNPSDYNLTKVTDTTLPTVGNLRNSASLQILDGSTDARISLKACMDKTIFVKMPKEGEINAAGQVESDLNAGDSIEVYMNIPSANTVDIYCHKHSLKVMGIGEPDVVDPFRTKR